MTATKAQKIRLGLFGISAAAAAALVLVVFAGLRFWEKKTHYVIYFENSVLGLEEGAAVSFAGVKVGKVDDIAVAPDDLRKVKVTIAVKAGTPVRPDTTATLTMAGITGLKAIDLRGGDVRSPRLAPGGVIPAGEATLDHFEREARSLFEQSREIMQHANRVVTNLELLTEPGQFKGLGEIVDSARAASANLADAAAGLRAIVGENRGAIRRTVASVEQVTGRAATLVDGDLPRLVGNASSFVDELRGVVRDNSTFLRSALFDLRQASRSLKEMARDVRQRPSRLLFAKPAHERRLP